MDRQDTINFRCRRRRTESVDGVKRCVSKSGCCATPLVSERGVEFSPRVHPRSARASPAVKHGVSPLGTVGAGWEVSLPLHFSTGSPFGHHPRLRIVCPPLGTVGKRTRSSPYTSSRGVENLYTICGHTPSMSPFQRRSRTR